jgi:choline dehydrogenase-like flavoprotein
VARNRSVASILVRIEAEQTPNPHSRVVLTSQSDALGMQKAALDWRINRDDLDSMYQAVMAVAHGVGASGFGRMLVNMEQPVDDAKISTAWHHMGTTRMDDDRRQGVVDRNCRVHGLANFFVAGSSVFPTGSRANPTLTIVALAIRLADQLKRTVKPT